MGEGGWEGGKMRPRLMFSFTQATGPLWCRRGIKTKTAILGEFNTTNILNNPTGPHNCVAKAAECKVGSLGSNERLSLNNNLF